MPSLAELLGYLIQPRGGPMLPALAKAPSNATATGIPGVRGPAVSSPAEMMAALTAIGNAQYENKLREAQAEQARSTASLFKAAVELGGQGPTYETGLPSVPSTATPAAMASPVFGSLGGDVGGASRISDPRGVEPMIRAAATRYGHDPDTAVKVARSEGLGTFFGDGGKSGTAFQLYTGGGLGNEFQKETGLDPLNPKNEPDAIDWAMRNLDRTGWSPYHGAAKVGIGPREGIASGALGAAGLPSAIPAPAAASGLPRLDAASLARAQRMENIYGILGKKMPTWAEEGIKMAPGGSQSLEYLGAVASTKKWAEAAPELFTQTQLKTLQAGLDLSLKEKQALLDRASEEQKQRLAASLDVVPVTVRTPDGGTEERMVPRSELASSVASPARAAAGAQATPATQTLPSGAVIAGKPTGIGPVAPDYRLVTPPEGGAPRQERILGSPAAQAAEQAQGEKQQAADIMKQDIGRALKLSGEGWSTGVAGAASQGIPGTPAYNLKAVLNGISANTAFDRITQMRNASQTGAALGAVSDRDLELLKSTMGSLEQSQNKEQFEFNLKRLHNIAQDVINGAPTDLEAAVKSGKLSQSQFNQAMGRRKRDMYDLGADASPTFNTSPGGVEWRIK